LIHGLAAALLLAAGCATTASQQGKSQSFPLLDRQGLFKPGGSPWTILCLELRGPLRMENLEEVAETLRRTPGIRPDDVVVRDDPDEAGRLYYGLYYRKTDPETGKRDIPQRLKEDMELLKEFATPEGRRYFMYARTIRIPTPDVGNPDWNLTKVNAAYSLQVAAFEPTDEFWEFKQAAAEYCALLRDKGYEAYYYHGEGGSIVTVGKFDRDALKIPEKGFPIYSDEVRKLQQEELLKYNLLNGSIYSARSDKGQLVRVPSQLVEIPRPGDLYP